MRRIVIVGAGLVVLLLIAGGFVLRNAALRYELKTALGLEPLPEITPLALSAPVANASTRTQPATRTPTPQIVPSATASATASMRAATNQPASPTLPPTETPTPAPPTVPPTPAPVERNGRLYDVYLDAAVKNGQAYQYSCEFDAAWVILQTFGINADVDEIISRTPIDGSIEPFYEETANGFVIHGGDIFSAYSGDYRKNFLARSTGAVFVPVFASYGLRAEPVSDRAGLQAALRGGGLVWIKTTVDFKPWRPATWITPEGRTHQTVLGNDHAVVVMGFNQDVVVIRDVLGPTSTGRNRPLEYEVAWDTFLRSWGAQENDGVAVFGS